MFVINELTLEEIKEYDIFNYNNTHSHEKDDRYDYNCMAYAFGAFEWLNPINPDYESPEAIMEELGLNINNLLIYQNIEEALDTYNFNNHFLRKVIIQRILNAFPHLRIVSSFDNLKEDEYGIAFATGCDDYHFIRYDNGVYSHKRGTLNIEVIENEEDGFYNRYNSKIVRFAIKNEPIEFNETF